MKTKYKILLALFAAVLLISCLIQCFYTHARYGFSREVAEAEKHLRQNVVAAAEKWLDTREGSQKHSQILHIYNSHLPLAQDYPVKPEDNWCAAFASAVAIECNLTDIIPTECGCERQTYLWKELGRWQEKDTYLPLPGDYIYYAWDEKNTWGDCTGWSDHVGIVVGTAGPFIKVIEGNKDDTVTYRKISRFDPQIRGYGLPDYGSKNP